MYLRPVASVLRVLGLLVACDHETTPSRTSGGAALTTADAASPKEFGASCLVDDECPTHVCFHKRLKSPDAGKEQRGVDEPLEKEGYCSMKCASDAGCPSPPTNGKCGARGMCKRP
jgi:hypothetical protein